MQTSWKCINVNKIKGKGCLKKKIQLFVLFQMIYDCGKAEKNNIEVQTYLVRFCNLKIKLNQTKPYFHSTFHRYFF